MSDEVAGLTECHLGGALSDELAGLTEGHLGGALSDERHLGGALSDEVAGLTECHLGGALSDELAGLTEGHLGGALSDERSEETKRVERAAGESKPSQAVRLDRRADSSSTGSGAVGSNSTSVDSTSRRTLPTAMPNTP